MMSCPKLLVPLVAWPFLLFASAVADEADVFNVDASLTSLHDNNLFRLASGVDARSIGLQEKSDVVNVTALDFSLNKRISLQRVTAKVSLVDNRYRNNDFLDFRALNYDAKWLWAMGSRWNGELSFERKEALNSFADYRSNLLQRNVRTTEDERFTANYWWHANWAAFAGVFRTSATNEQPFLAESDYSGTGYHLGLRFRPRSGNTLSFRTSRLDGEYRKRSFNTVSQFDNGFSEDLHSLDMNWLLSGKSRLLGRIGYRDRQHERFSRRDYAGWIGNLDYTYDYSGHGNVSVGYKRDIQAYQQVTNSYYTLDELKLSSEWLATSKIAAVARVAYGRRNYDGAIISLPAGFEQRQDIYSRVGADLSYRPMRWLQLTAGIAYEKRAVNNSETLDYRDRTGFVAASAQF